VAAPFKRALGFRDLLLFYVVTVFSLRWIATAAAAGPSALVVWAIAAVGLFVPLVFTVLELSTRYPGEGGMYIWSREAFGPFAGFMTGWTYWGANLPYFPGLLYFAAANAIFVGGRVSPSLSSSSTYFLAVSLAGLAVAVGLNIVGLGVAKWLSNAGGFAGWLAAALLIVTGLTSWVRFGPAVPLSAASFVPGAGLKDIVFWSTIAFAFGGIEGASTMGEEIEDAQTTVPRAVMAAALAIVVLYMAGTLAVIVATPAAQVTGLQGFLQAIEAIGGRIGAPWLARIAAVLVTINVLGGVDGWFAATARLPFVVGVDRFLPRAFAELHPRWGTPHVALLTQAAIAGFFVVLGQAGTSVRGAYDALVSMGIVAYFIPYLFMFAAMVKLQARPAGPGVLRTPGGRGVAVLLGLLGWLTTAVSIGLALVPPADEPDKTLAVVKVAGASAALVAAGVVVYAFGRRRAISA
jgi:amino acid transporter